MWLFQITRTGKRSLRPANETKEKKNIRARIQSEPTESALGLIIPEQRNESAILPPTEVPEIIPVPNEDQVIS